MGGYIGSRAVALSTTAADVTSLTIDSTTTVSSILDQDDMSSNSATALATQQSIKAYVDAQVGTADTLSEVLALGNTTGGTNILFGDSDKAIFGAGSDLQIYHDGSNSFISDESTGNLVIRGSSEVSIQDPTGSRFSARFIDADQVILYHNGNDKLNTTSTGIGINGNATFPDNGKAIFGAGSDLQIYHNPTGSHSYITESGGGSLYIQGTELNLTNAAGTSTYANFVDGGAAFIRHAGSTKMATSASGIDVTGTVTADGLTVDGDAEISGTASRLYFTETDVADKNTRLVSSGGDFFIQTSSDDKGTNTSRFALDHATGDIRFYGTSGNAKLFWDASAESLGIGSASDGAILQLDRASSSYLDIQSDSTLRTRIYNDSSQTILETTTNNLIFKSVSSEAMRINSSGHLLIGKTADDNTTAGIALHDNGFMSVARSANVAMILDRHDSDGDILRFTKSGSTVGSISSRGGVATNLILRTATGQGAGIGGANSGVLPCDEDGLQDDEINLGASGTRWKDLWLSGGVYLGGTGSANKLDDYEEGTFTPTITFGNNNTGMAFSTRGGFYTKVGQLVTVMVEMTLSAKGSSTGTVKYEGLPFTAKAGTQDHCIASQMIRRVPSGEDTIADLFHLFVVSNATHCILRSTISTGDGSPGDGNYDDDTRVSYTLSYLTDA